MVIDENNISQINAALLIIQRRIDRIVQAMNEFTEKLKECETIEDIKELDLKI